MGSFSLNLGYNPGQATYSGDGNTVTMAAPSGSDDAQIVGLVAANSGKRAFGVTIVNRGSNYNFSLGLIKQSAENTDVYSNSAADTLFMNHQGDVGSGGTIFYGQNKNQYLGAYFLLAFDFVNLEWETLIDGVTYGPWPMNQGTFAGAGSMPKMVPFLALYRGCTSSKFAFDFSPASLPSGFVPWGNEGVSPPIFILA